MFFLVLDSQFLYYGFLSSRGEKGAEWRSHPVRSAVVRIPLRPAPLRPTAVLVTAVTSFLAGISMVSVLLYVVPNASWGSVSDKAPISAPLPGSLRGPRAGNLKTQFIFILLIIIIRLIWPACL